MTVLPVTVRRYGPLVAAWLLFLAAPLPVLADGPALSVVDLKLVSSTRVTRTRFTYTYRVTAKNSFLGQPAATNVSLRVTSTSPSMVITDGDVSFPTMLGGQTADGVDTFEFIQDRTAPFDASALRFEFSWQNSYLVPDLIGKTKAEAIAAIIAAGYWEGGIGWYNDPVIPLGSVVGQYPLGGTVLNPPDTVNFSLSLGTGATNSFGMSVPFDSLQIEQGDGVRVPVGLTRASGFSGPIEVTLLDPPAGITSNVLSVVPPLSEGLLSVRVATNAPFMDHAFVVIVARAGLQEARRAVRLTVTPATPSTRERIDAALAAGTIDLGTSYVYRMFAAFDDPKLPVEYIGRGRGSEDQQLLYDIDRNLAQISAANQALLHPYLVRPTDPDSIWNQPPAAAVGRARLAAAAPAVALAPFLVLESDSCPVSIIGPTWIYQRVPRIRTGPAPIVAWVRCYEGKQDEALYTMQGAVESLENLIAPMIALMGPPIGDAGTGGLDPDTAIDVYVVPRGQAVARDGGVQLLKEPAFTYPVDMGRRPKSSSFVVVSDRTATTGDAWEELHFTITHELFHVLANAHNSYGVGKNAAWWWFVEASATWAAVHFDITLGWPGRYSGVAHEDRFRSFQASGLPLNDSSTKDNSHAYASYVWPFFMQLQLGRPAGAAAVALVWSSIESVSEGVWDSSPNVLDDAIDAVFSFKNNFADFTRTNLNVDTTQFLLAGGTDPLPLSERYVSLDPGQFPDHVLPSTPPLREIVVDSPVHQDDKTQQILLKPLSAIPLELFVKGSSVREVEVNWATVAPRTSLDVDAIVWTRADGWMRRRLSTRVNDVFCTGSGTGQALFGWIVFSNSTHKDGDITGTVTITTRTTAEPRSFECGCASANYCPQQLTGRGTVTPFDINLAGHVAGFSQSPVNAFGVPTVWSTYPDLPFFLLPANDPRPGIALHINDAEQVVGPVGSLGIPGFQGTGFWPNFAPASSPTPVSPSSTKSGLNNKGEVAVANSATHRLYLWSGGAFEDLGAGDTALDLNDYGQVLFQRCAPSCPGDAFVWQHGTVTAVPINPRAMNNLGVVVGGTPPAAGPVVPVRWTTRYGVQPLPIPPAPTDFVIGGPPQTYVPEFLLGVASGINDRGEIVGEVQWRYRGSLNPAVEAFRISRAVLWRADGSPVDLTYAVGLFSGICLTSATAINERGWITSSGEFNPQARGVVKDSMCSVGSGGFRLIPPLK